MDLMDPNLFRESDGPPKDYDWTECEICGLGCVVERGTTRGQEWHQAHECPEPYPQEQAQRVWDTLVYPGSIVNPRTKARLRMSWRAGFIKER
jgi:hypothetical protein